MLYNNIWRILVATLPLLIVLYIIYIYTNLHAAFKCDCVCMRTHKQKKKRYICGLFYGCVCVLVRASVCIYFRINLWCVRRAYAWWWWRISKRIESCYLYICMKYCAHVAWRRGGRVDGKTSQCQHIMCAARRLGSCCVYGSTLFFCCDHYISYYLHK